VLLASIAVFGLSSFGQDEVIKVETAMVKVPVTVLDRLGRTVTGLDLSNFRLLEDGQEQSISFFRTVDEPATVLLLLDQSGSMNDYLIDVGRASANFIGALRDDDTIAVAGFSDDGKIHLLCEPTQKKDFRQIINLHKGYERDLTTTFNAVEKAIKFMRQFSGRKAIVLFSDGELFGRGVSANDNFRDAEEQESLIYTVRFGLYPTHAPGSGNWRWPPTEKEKAKLTARANAYLEGLSQRTGGRSLEVLKLEELGEAFRLISEELGRQYLLGYTPLRTPVPGERRRLVVKVTAPNVAVRARNEVVFRQSER
jgi:VWFA-related protein